MRTRHLLTAALAAALLIGLTGCGTSAKLHGKHHPTPSATPVFSSEEEALAAAEAAYARSEEVSLRVLSEGGSNAERLRAVATGEYLEASLEGAANFAEKGYRITGESTFDRVVLQRYDPSGGEAFIAIYVCGDISGVDVIDEAGKSIVLSTREDQTYFEVLFDQVGLTSNLLVSAREVWGDGTCPS